MIQRPQLENFTDRSEQRETANGRNSVSMESYCEAVLRWRELQQRERELRLNQLENHS